MAANKISDGSTTAVATVVTWIAKGVAKGGCQTQQDNSQRGYEKLADKLAFQKVQLRGSHICPDIPPDPLLRTRSITPFIARSCGGIYDLRKIIFRGC